MHVFDAQAIIDLIRAITQLAGTLAGLVTAWTALLQVLQQRRKRT
jgi:hypothetical protein